MTTFLKEMHGCGVVRSCCEDCNECHESYFVLGDTHRPQLMQCSRCDSIYYYDKEYAHYIRPLERQIEGKLCEACGARLVETLRKYKPSKKCAKCGGKLKRGDVQQQATREFYEIYSDRKGDQKRL